MNDHKFKKLLSKYEKGRANTNEIKIIESFFKDMQRDGIDHDQLKANLKVKNSIYHKIESKLNGTANVTQFQGENNAPKRSFFNTTFSQKFRWSIAASFMFIIGLSIFFYHYSQPDIIVLTTGRGEQNSFMLPDSSLVRLNASSKISYPEDFGENNREIYLEGEAFFKVKHKTNTSFIVHSSLLTTRVLGTQFSVSAYPKEISKVIVLAGKVNVRDIHQHQQFLIRNESAVFINGNLEKEIVNAIERLSWKEGGLYFDHASFKEVIQILQRRLDIDFEAPNLSFQNHRLTGDFTGQNLDDILKSIQFIFQVNYQYISDNKIKITTSKN